jgi:glycosyltransferase involved in cell wall biosynthesis
MAAAVRPRINWFSPLPPANTAIAEYALTTLRALAQHADVVVWTDRPYWPLELEAAATVRQWDGESWPALNMADATLYHIGNNVRFHGWIWEVARRHPGVMVLHETRLHEFFAGQLLDNAADETAYLAAVGRCYGAEGLSHARRFMRGDATAGELAETLPMTELALERARGAVVHTAGAFADAVAIRRCGVLQLDLPYDAGLRPRRRPWDGILRLIVFGYLAPNRRIETVLEAIATFPSRSQLRLDICGQLHDPAPLADAIRARQLDDLVRVRGYLPEAELDAMLDQAGLAVNLRNPTMGEASHSQLRIWSHGLASLVSQTGWYAELPPETVGFVDPDYEIRDLHAHFARALADPETLRAIGSAGRHRLETQHDPAMYARELVAGIPRMMARPVSVAGAAERAVARVMHEGAMPRATAAAVARRAAEEIVKIV